MSTGLVPRLAVVLGFLLAGLWLATESVARPWVISGDSMEPSLSHGDRVIVDIWTYRHRAPRPGELVLLRGPLPSRPFLVKRATASPSGADLRPLDGLWPSGPHQDGVWVVGDHPTGSTDSRHFGSVPPAEISGRILFRYWKK